MQRTDFGWLQQVNVESSAVTNASLQWETSIMEEAMLVWKERVNEKSLNFTVNL